MPDPGNDVLLYAVSASSPDDVYAVGQEGSSFPSQTLLEHYNGREWSITSSEEDRTETLDPFGLDATPGGVTVVGARESDVTPFTTLVASGTSAGVTLQSSPSNGAGENDLFGAATAADGSTWAVGWDVEPSTELHRTLIEHGVDGHWSLVASPNPSEEETASRRSRRFLAAACGRSASPPTAKAILRRWSSTTTEGSWTGPLLEERHGLPRDARAVLPHTLGQSEQPSGPGQLGALSRRLPTTGQAVRPAIDW